MTLRFSGAILVGGRSSRMGTDKAALFADRIEAVLRDAGAGDVVRVGRDHLPDDVDAVGPLGGIATALRVAQHEMVMVLACDLPHVATVGIRTVVDALDRTPDALVAHPPGEPLHAAWRRAARPAVLRQSTAADRSVRALLRSIPAVEVHGIDPRSLTNVNTPADLVQTESVSDTEIPEIDIEELARRHEAGAFVLDVRNPDEYEEAHVPGAVLIPLGELDARVAEVPEGEVLVICRSGPRSARAVQALNAAGRSTVNVAGGTLAWIRAGFPVVSGSDPA